MRVLISEEDAIARQILSSTLRSWGYEVEIAHDAHETKTILCEENAPPIVILDWPRSDAQTPELFCRLQQLPPEQQPYLIVTSQRGREQDFVAALWAGADDYLSKPINIAELRSRVQVGERIARLQEQLHAKEQVLAKTGT